MFESFMLNVSFLLVYIQTSLNTALRISGKLCVCVCVCVSVLDKSVLSQDSK